jgi:CheY-like chemotaxis protein
MEGWAVLAALKADSTTSHIPVIMVTMLEDKSMGFALGAADYVTKPFDRDRMAEILKRYAHAGANGRSSILVVEDDKATRQMLRKLLERENWVVEEATNGRIGLEKLEQLRGALPTLILLDLMMPEMDGFEVVEALQADEEWRSIPVVVVTAKDINAAERNRLAGTVQQIMQKGSYSREELLGQVRKLIAARVEAA